MSNGWPMSRRSIRTKSGVCCIGCLASTCTVESAGPVNFTLPFSSVTAFCNAPLLLSKSEVSPA
jgi:hypothetical protein